jgi:hypothetical protein
MGAIISKIRQTVLLSFMVMILFVGCKKDKDEEPRKWVRSYSNVTLGDQHNVVAGHFFQPSIGSTVALESTTGVEKKLAMMFFTESGGSNTFLTFPANGETAATFGTADIRLFSQNPQGVSYWDNAEMVSGMVYKPASLTTALFDQFQESSDWDEFDQFFKNHNNDAQNLEFKATWRLNPSAGDVLLVQFQGYVRAIICVRNVVPSSDAGGSIRFDAIVEGKEIWEKNENAKDLQPL